MDRRVTAYLVVRRAAEALDFYSRAFGATLEFKLVDPGDGRIGHAEMLIGESRIMLSDEYRDFGAVGPDTLGGTPVTLHLMTDAVDEEAARAVAAGATMLRPPADQFFGERNALVQDPFGHRWMLAQITEAVDPAEMQRRWGEAAPR